MLKTDIWQLALEQMRRNVCLKQQKTLILSTALVDWDIDKEDILDWWEEQDFDLEIPEHFGICFGVGKKPISEEMTIINEDPSAFNFPEKMEKKYHTTGVIAQMCLKMEF